MKDDVEAAPLQFEWFTGGESNPMVPPRRGPLGELQRNPIFSELQSVLAAAKIDFSKLAAKQTRTKQRTLFCIGISQVLIGRMPGQSAALLKRFICLENLEGLLETFCRLPVFM